MTKAAAGEALGISEASVGLYEAGVSSDGKRPVEIPRVVALACAAISMGISPYGDHSNIEQRNTIEFIRGVADRLKREEEETITIDEVEDLLAAPTPLAFWRKKRAISDSELARQTGIPCLILSEIEAGNKTADAATLEKIASVLNVALDDLI